MNLTFRVHQRAVKRHARLAGHHLSEFDRALEWAEMGRMPNSEAPTTTPDHHEIPANDG
jgi:hypothetical protein